MQNFLQKYFINLQVVSQKSCWCFIENLLKLSHHKNKKNFFALFHRQTAVVDSTIVKVNFFSKIHSKYYQLLQQIKIAVMFVFFLLCMPYKIY